MLIAEGDPSQLEVLLGHVVMPGHGLRVGTSLGTLFLCRNLSSVLKLVDVITASSTVVGIKFHSMDEFQLLRSLTAFVSFPFVCVAT